MSSFPERLAIARNKLGLTQAQLAEKIGVKSGKQVIYKWEKGQQEPNLSQLARLAQELNTSVSWLLSDSYDPDIDPASDKPVAPPGFVILPADEVIHMQRELLKFQQEGRRE